MAQVKLLKIGADGFQAEHGSADDISFATLTAATQVAVTGGVTITNNISFNAVSDTIAGIQNQNLLDKTDNETITGNWTIATGHYLTVTDAPTNGTDAANKDYVDSVAQGLEWQDSVINILNTPPGSPTTGDRYIVGTSPTGAWVGKSNQIAQWNGTAWVYTIPAEGFAAFVDDLDTAYVYNGSAWVKMATIYQHNDLGGLQGGTTAEYYHMTAAEDTWVGAGQGKGLGGNIVYNNVNDTLSATYTLSGRLNAATGSLVLPTGTYGTPVEGDVRWDGSTDTLYIYDGAAWKDVSSSGSASYIATAYTAGAGGIAQYDAVYISGADTVLKCDADALATSKFIGFAKSTVGAGSSVLIQEDGVLTGILSGATAGDAYFLSVTPGLISTNRPSGAGDVVFRVGYAKNGTDLHIQPQFVGIRS